MAIFLYSLLVLFILLPLNVVALKKVKANQALGAITNNIVASQLRWTSKMGTFYWVVFYGLHVLIALVLLDRLALVSLAGMIGYMVVTHLLQKALVANGWTIKTVDVANAPQPPVL
jgi:hypothetical protein